MIGLPAVTFLTGEDGADGEARIHVETKASPVGCPTCGVVARVKDRSQVELVDLPMFGRSVRLVWHKRRWRCADANCTKGSWTEEELRIAAPRQVLTARAAPCGCNRSMSVSSEGGSLHDDHHVRHPRRRQPDHRPGC
ncbi:MAG: transposase family protein [Acidimicrobiales bacterium]